jgi:TRAP-type C4-dicarboxylate transport system permease small subunit
MVLASAFGSFLEFSSIVFVLVLMHFSYAGFKRVIYSVLPMLAILGYLLEYVIFRLLSQKWQHSPYLKWAALAPYFGCVLVVVIYLDDLRASRDLLRKHNVAK